jgi:RNA polymerase sigma-70 factor (ECF subfamily)
VTEVDDDDRVLVRALLAGREDAFEAFFDRYFPPLYRFALARTGRDAALAEEAVSAALSRALEKLPTFRGEAALLTWLCTFCRREISALRRARGASRFEDLAEEDPEIRAALESLALAEDDPERALERRELSRLVQLTLDHLPPRYGDALEWKYIEGATVVEIAGRFGLGAKAAESLLTRARQAFRDGFDSLRRAGRITPIRHQES